VYPQVGGARLNAFCERQDEVLDDIAAGAGGVSLSEVGGQIEGAADERAAAGPNRANGDRRRDVGFADAGRMSSTPSWVAHAAGAIPVSPLTRLPLRAARASFSIVSFLASLVSVDAVVTHAAGASRPPAEAIASWFLTSLRSVRRTLTSWLITRPTQRRWLISERAPGGAVRRQDPPDFVSQRTPKFGLMTLSSFSGRGQACLSVLSCHSGQFQ